MGHTKEEYPDLPREVRACHSCQQHGHIAVNCPQTPLEKIIWTPLMNLIQLPRYLAIFTWSEDMRRENHDEKRAFS